MKNEDRWMRGIPYVGNKGQIAQKIIDELPTGKRFFDVFGGGGSMSLHAVNSGKYESVVYNNNTQAEADAFRELLFTNKHADLFKSPPALTRDEFKSTKERFNSMPNTRDFLLLTIWSFSNDLTSYLGRDDLTNEKIKAQQALWGAYNEYSGVYEFIKPNMTVAERYAVWRKWRHENIHRLQWLGQLKQLEQLSRLEQLERLQHLQQLQQLQQLERLHQLNLSERLHQLQINSYDYRFADIESEDVVYLDPPYVGTSVLYGGWDENEFEDWYMSLPADEVYISNYEHLPNTEVIAEFSKHSLTAKGTRRKELLLKVVK